LNNYGRKAALRPADALEQQLYACPESTEFVGVLTICNQDSSERTFRIAHTDSAGEASGEDWKAYDKIIAPNFTMQITGITMSVGETIRVQASIADKISFILDGVEKT